MCRGTVNYRLTSREHSPHISDVVKCFAKTSLKARVIKTVSYYHLMAEFSLADFTGSDLFNLLQLNAWIQCVVLSLIVKCN